jgi:hypothetical protein
LTSGLWQCLSSSCSWLHGAYQELAWRVVVSERLSNSYQVADVKRANECITRDGEPPQVIVHVSFVAWMKCNEIQEVSLQDYTPRGSKGSNHPAEALRGSGSVES